MSSNDNGGIKRNRGMAFSAPLWPSLANPAPQANPPVTAASVPTTKPPPIASTAIFNALVPAANPSATANAPAQQPNSAQVQGNTSWGQTDDTGPDEHSPMDWCSTWCYINNLDPMDLREDYPGFGRRCAYEKERQEEYVAWLDRELNAVSPDSDDEESGPSEPSKSQPAASSNIPTAPTSTHTSPGSGNQWNDIS